MKIYIKSCFFAILLLSVFSCKKPTENIKLVVDTDILKYTAFIRVTDAANGTLPANAKITISGAAADNIYEISGKKNFNLVQGVVTIGLGPALTPTASNPVTCTATITANGYTTATRTITFTADKSQQIINIQVAKVGSTTPPIVVPDPPVYPTPVVLNFIGTCRNRSDFEIRPSVYIMFRETGSNQPYQYLGYMDKGVLNTTTLGQGKTYDFQTSFNGENLSVTQKIEQASYSLTLDMGNACSNF
ncbi:hypothetical protein MUGA111182_04060 [Mucilaginibacter galii]|uniref:DUF4249 family protein n=1 Tax=Mucilaginibacter galii TaxID=2005073 RepID=A0A917N1K5_9SPHI|nr:hypothetical protein [Mucilaginibacter galii]GGI50943.1 hypothetical protein GCM10011425_21550 [Mucilaginibacter galii]